MGRYRGVIVTRWTPDEPGRPPRVITEPLTAEPLKELYTWANDALGKPAEPSGNACLKCGGGPLEEWDANWADTDASGPRPFEVGDRVGTHDWREGTVIGLLGGARVNVQLALGDATFLASDLRHLDEPPCKCGDRGRGDDDATHTPERCKWSEGRRVTKVSAAEPASTEPAETRFEVGDVVDARAGGRAWIVRVMQVRDGRWGFRVRYSDASEEWLLPDDLRRHATPEERATYETGEDAPRPFKLGDVVVWQDGSATSGIGRLTKLGSEGVIVDGRHWHSPHDIRHATDEERTTYDGLRVKTILARAEELADERKREPHNPFTVNQRPFETVVVGEETIRWDDIESTTVPVDGDSVTLHLKDGRALILDRADFMRMSGVAGER